MGKEDASGFDSAKAELFEALGHPNRIRIIQALDERPVGFAELKKKVGMESSGHLAFHLGKLDHLVVLGDDGQYKLTEDGKDALRMVRAAREKSGEVSRRGRTIEVRKTVLVGLVVFIVILAAFAGIQQLRISQLSAQPSEMSTLAGRGYWYTTLSLAGLPMDQNLSFLFHGVWFTLVPTGLVAFSPAIINAAGATTMSGGRNFTIIVSSNSSVGGGQGGVAFYVTPLQFAPSENVKVAFPDGSQEVMRLTWPAYNSATMTFYDAHQTFPWFSFHTNPQAAIVEGNGTLTMYVSAGE